MGPRVRALFFYRIWMGVVPVFSPCILPGGEDLPGPGGCRTISERSLIRSDRSPEDRRRIEGLTSKPRPNSEPAQSDLTLSTALSGTPVIAAMLSGLVPRDLVLRCHLSFGIIFYFLPVPYHYLYCIFAGKKWPN